MGEVNLFEVTSLDGTSLQSNSLTIAKGITQSTFSVGDKGLLMVRPEDVQFAEGNDSFDYMLKGKIHAEFALGSRIQYEVEADGKILTVETLREGRIQDPEGMQVTLGFNAAKTHLIGDT
jgi:spermidine/putrescine transport system ATP-binding protein